MLPFITDYINRAFPPPPPDATPTMLQKVVMTLNANMAAPGLFNSAEQQRLAYAKNVLQLDDAAIKLIENRRRDIVAAFDLEKKSRAIAAPDDKTI